MLHQKTIYIVTIIHLFQQFYSILIPCENNEQDCECQMGGILQYNDQILK